MPLFLTNNEFTAIYEYLNENFPGLEVWVRILVIKSSFRMPRIDYRWKNESFDNSLWSTFDPNGECTGTGKTSCCAVIKSNSNLIGHSLDHQLIDSDVPCVKRYCNFLCEAPDDKQEDRCLGGSHDCSHTCIDTQNGYNCSCPSGFQLDVDGRTCIDIDECTSTTFRCDQHCLNEIGSFKCECSSGYYLQQMYSCVDIDECQTNASVCDQECLNSPGSYVCSCYSGFSSALDNRTCEDINECALYETLCQSPGLCVNNHGSYSCECPYGYVKVGTNSTNATCEDKDECALDLVSCPSSSACINNVGSYTCSCVDGYQLHAESGLCVDLDECLDASHNCSQNCINIPGSFNCSCLDGYEGNGFQCEDIDECNNIFPVCDQLCSNSPGSFQCLCSVGFLFDSYSKTCTDIDECSNDAARCDQVCNNSLGSYSCSCHAGYFLDVNYSCVDINECIVRSHDCEQACINVDGSFKCHCFNGYSTRPENSSGCQDIDECLNEQCSENERCINTQGSFQCACSAGYRYDVNNSSCVDIEGYSKDGHGCIQISADSVSNYSCQCPTGFQDYNAVCKDIDECSNPRLNTCDQLCVNSVGSFTCSCNEGYSLINTTLCEDNNECQGGKNFSCEQTCLNTEGSFLCACEAGYSLYSDGTHCYDIDECNSEDNITGSAICEGSCVNTIGSYHCSRSKGLHLAANLTSCVKQEEKKHCKCPCHTLLGDLDKLKKSLLVDKTNLTAFKGKLYCAEDFRIFPRVLGYSSVLIMIACVSALVFIDVCSWAGRSRCPSRKRQLHM